jgi:hypothetical protein
MGCNALVAFAGNQAIWVAGSVVKEKDYTSIFLLHFCIKHVQPLFHCSCSHPSFFIVPPITGKLIFRFLKHLGSAAFPFLPYNNTLILKQTVEATQVPKSNK